MSHATSRWYELSPELVNKVICTDYKRLRIEWDGNLRRLVNGQTSKDMILRDAKREGIEVVRFYTYLERVK